MLRIPNRVEPAVTLKSWGGAFCFGRLEWAREELLQVRLDASPPPGTRCDLRLELSGRGVSVVGRVEVLALDSAPPTEMRGVVCRIVSLGPDDRERLMAWLSEWEEGGSSPSPARWMADLSRTAPSTISGVQQAQARDSLGLAMRAALATRTHRSPTTRPRELEGLEVEVCLESLVGLTSNDGC